MFHGLDAVYDVIACCPSPSLPPCHVTQVASSEEAGWNSPACFYLLLSWTPLPVGAMVEQEAAQTPLIFTLLFLRLGGDKGKL